MCFIIDYLLTLSEEPIGNTNLFFYYGNVLNLNMGIWKACVSATIDCFFFPDIRDLKCDVHHLNDVYYPFVTWRRSTKFALTMSRTFYLYQRGGFGEKTRTNSEIIFIQNTAIRFNGRTMDGPVITPHLIHYVRWPQYRRPVGILKDWFQFFSSAAVNSS